jgi:hypothetical protein
MPLNIRRGQIMDWKYIPSPNHQPAKTRVDEAIARSLIEDTIGCFPSEDTTVMCGDWNTRIANLAPNLDDVSTARLSDDKQTNQRTPWLLEICE